MKSKFSFLSLYPIVSIFVTRVYSQCTPFTYDKSKPYSSQGILVDYNSQNVHQSDKTLNLHLTQSTGGTRISLKDTLHYGRVESRFRIASGTNIVSSFILMADNKDEIDYEFVQNTNVKTNTIQTNYFYRGIPIFDKNAKFYKSKNPLADEYHTYTLNWTPDKYEWIFDGILLRTLKRNETTNFPDSASKIQFGIWNANPSSWAGPGVEWKNEPFVFSIETIRVICNGHNPTTTSTVNSSSTAISSPATSSPAATTTAASTTAASSSVTNKDLPAPTSTHTSSNFGNNLNVNLGLMSLLAYMLFL
jgi:beta-glucanase (GH16 family)